MKSSELKKILKEVEGKTQFIEYSPGRDKLPLIIRDRPEREIITQSYPAECFDPVIDDLFNNTRDVISCELWQSSGSQVYAKRLWVNMPKLLESASHDLEAGLLEGILREEAYIAVEIGGERHAAETKYWSDFFKFLKEETSNKKMDKFHLNVNMDARKGFFFHAEKGKSATLSWNDYQLLRKVGNHIFPLEESKYVN